MKKICIIGTGAVGGLLAGHLAQTNHQLTLFDRDEQISELIKNGLTIINPDNSEVNTKNFTATSDLRSCSKQDIIILAVKAHQIQNLLTNLKPLLHDQTIIITLQNGIPWWYFKGQAGEFKDKDLQSLDPDGKISQYISSDRVIGCVAYCAAEIKQPGKIHHKEGYRFPLGELDGKTSPRILQVSEMFTEAGFKSPVLSDIRAEIWLKAWGSLAFNPISALTHSTLVEICDYPISRVLVKSMMLEAETIANKLGIKFRVSLEERINGAQKVGNHKTSMLQDVETGVELEIEAILSVILELGALTDTVIPYISAVYACTKLLDNTMQKNSRYIYAATKPIKK